MYILISFKFVVGKQSLIIKTPAFHLTKTFSILCVAFFLLTSCLKNLMFASFLVEPAAERMVKYQKDK